MYRQPLVKQNTCRSKSDVEIPPASSSYSYVFDEENLFKHSPLKKILETRKANDRTKFLTTPNLYNKVEQDGSPTGKWVPEDESLISTPPVSPTKTINSLQFVPKGTSNKEFKLKQKQIKENRRADKISAGPQSNLVEGVTWEEAKKIQESAVNGEHDRLIVGAASKGIIQRPYQQNAIVYKKPYKNNPFDLDNADAEITEYKRIIDAKNKGYYSDLDYTTDGAVTDVEGAQTDHEIIMKSTKPPLPPSPPKPIQVENLTNGDTLDSRRGNTDTLSSTYSSDYYTPSKEGSMSCDESVPKKKERKKKKGIRTPLFLKKKLIGKNKD